MTKIMVDSAWPQPDFPATDIVLIYVGGDTPHPWTDQDLQMPSVARTRYRLPTWVRDRPPWDAAADSAAFIAWLQAHKVSKGSATLLDLEMAVNPAYVNAFGSALHAAGYLVMPYGSQGYVFGNPALDGYFTAHYTGTPHFCSGSVGTQWVNDTMLAKPWDLSIIADSVPLWDTQPPPPSPAPTPKPIQEDDMYLFTWNGGVYLSLGCVFYRWVGDQWDLNAIKTANPGVKDLGVINGVKGFGVPTDPATAKLSGQPWPVTGPAT